MKNTYFLKKISYYYDFKNILDILFGNNIAVIFLFLY